MERCAMLAKELLKHSYNLLQVYRKFSHDSSGQA